MEVRTSMDGRVLTVTLRGELDHHAARNVVTAIERAIEASLPKQLMLDFRGVSFMDSSGIAVAMRARKSMEILGGSAEIVQVPAQAKKVFDAVGIRCQAGTEEKK